MGLRSSGDRHRSRSKSRETSSMDVKHRAGRSAGVAGVVLFLVAGAAFGANALTRSSTAGPAPSVEDAEPTETADDQGDQDDQGDDNNDQGEQDHAGAETPEPAETPEATDGSGDE